MDCGGFQTGGDLCRPQTSTAGDEETKAARHTISRPWEGRQVLEKFCVLRSKLETTVKLVTPSFEACYVTLSVFR